MDRYHIIKKVGEGSFGRVYQAIDHLTGQYVAIKQLKPNCHPMSYLPEVRALQILQHPKIVGFKGAERQHNTVFLVFEYMDGSLRHLINHRMRMGVPFSEAEIKFFSFQVLQGLDFMHRNRRFMHRDMKPENLLVNKHGVLKISDLGSATEIESDDSLFHHHYVTTRSYRAPEMLLRMFLKNEELRPFEYQKSRNFGALFPFFYHMVHCSHMLLNDSWMPTVPQDPHHMNSVLEGFRQLVKLKNPLHCNISDSHERQLVINLAIQQSPAMM
ncbi:PREDICTED: cyclin-dependent kinase F-4-like [Fragaria vesca subsp. vesca]